VGTGNFAAAFPEPPTRWEGFKMYKRKTVGGFMKNKLALCSGGQLGLITHDKRQPVMYADHSVRMAYVGIHLTDGPGRHVGDPWSARNPLIVGGIVQQPGGYAVTGFGLVPDVTSFDVPVKNE
jgi:hypothetical protein